MLAKKTKRRYEFSDDPAGRGTIWAATAASASAAKVACQREAGPDVDLYLVSVMPEW